MNILTGADIAVAKWVWETYQVRPINLDQALGVLDDDEKLVGAILLSNHNGFNIEFGYYGRDTLTLGLIRWLANYGLQKDVSRVTIVTSKKNRSILKTLGNAKSGLRAKLEGVSRSYYGQRDCPKNTAVRFALFRDDLVRLSAFRPHREKVA